MDERFEQAVNILRIAAAVHQLRAQHLGLFAQTGDGVDFAVVAKQGEGLHALENRGGVGGIARVPDGDRGGVIAAAQFGVVVIKRLDGAAHFVHHAVAGKRRYVDPRLRFNRQFERKQAAFDGLERATAHHAGDLPEKRFLGQGQSAQSLAACRAGALQQQVCAAFGDEFQHARLPLLDMRARGVGDHQMSHEEAPVVGQPRGPPGLFKGNRPQAARDVGEHPAAIPLALHVTGAMAHLAQGFNGTLEIPVGSFTAGANRSHNCTGVVFVDALAPIPMHKQWRFHRPPSCGNSPIVVSR